MNVLLVIDGREAIPVRAIPLLTNWEVLSPDVVADTLAGDSDFFHRFNGLTAHRIEQGVTKPISPTFWENSVVRDIDALSDRIEDRQVTHADGYSQWRAESLACLPAGAFVWRDEFEPRFWVTFGPDGESVLRASSADELEWVNRNQDIKLDFDPFIPSDDIARLVMGGFEAPGDGDEVRAQATAPSTATGKKVVRRNRVVNALTAVIELAQQNAVDRDDWTSVWAALVALAQRDDKPAPLLGYAEGEGVKYQSDSFDRPVAWLTRNAFRLRMRGAKIPT